MRVKFADEEGILPTKEGRTSHPRNSIVRNLESIELPAADRTNHFSSVLHHFYARHISGRPNGPTNDALFRTIFNENRPKASSSFAKESYALPSSNMISYLLDYVIFSFKEIYRLYIYSLWFFISDSSYQSKVVNPQVQLKQSIIETTSKWTYI